MNRTHIFIFQFSESDHTLSHSLTGPGGKLPLPLRAPGLSERDRPSRPRPGFLQTQEGRRQAAAPASRPWSLGRGQPKPPAPQLFADARRAAASCRSRFVPLVSRKGTAQAARAPAFCRRKKGGGKLPLPLRAPGLLEGDSPSRPRPGFLQTQEGRRQAAAPASRSWSLGRGQPKPPAPRLFADARRAAASCRSRFALLISWKGTAKPPASRLFADARRAGLASRPPCLKKEIYEKETCTQNFSWKCLCSPTGPAPPYRWNQ